MKRLITACVVIAACAAAAGAQGRGGRQGGPGGGGIAGPLCINPADVHHFQTQTTTGMTDGGPMSTTVVTITGNPGAGRLLAPCAAMAGGQDPLAKNFFAPELIMAHQQAIGLSDAQQRAIQSILMEGQNGFAPLQFKLAGEVEKLQGVLADASADETKALEALDRVLAAERDIKHRQVSMMVRLKNALTPQQQEALSRMRPE